MANDPNVTPASLQRLRALAEQGLASGNAVVMAASELSALLTALDRRAEGETCGTCKHGDPSAQYKALIICSKGVRSAGYGLSGIRDRYCDKDFGCNRYEAAPPSGGQPVTPTPEGGSRS